MPAYVVDLDMSVDDEIDTQFCVAVIAADRSEAAEKAVILVTTGWDWLPKLDHAPTHAQSVSVEDYSDDIRADYDMRGQSLSILIQRDDRPQ